jgi:hypothetical protein
MKLISGCKNDRRQKEVEEELIVEANGALDECTSAEPNGESHDHAWAI